MYHFMWFFIEYERQLCLSLTFIIDNCGFCNIVLELHYTWFLEVLRPIFVNSQLIHLERRRAQRKMKPKSPQNSKGRLTLGGQGRSSYPLLDVSRGDLRGCALIQYYKERCGQVLPKDLRKSGKICSNMEDLAQTDLYRRFQRSRAYMQ